MAYNWTFYRSISEIGVYDHTLAVCKRRNWTADFAIQFLNIQILYYSDLDNARRIDCTNIWLSANNILPVIVPLMPSMHYWRLKRLHRSFFSPQTLFNLLPLQLCQLNTTCTMATLTSDQIKVLEQSRQRLAQLTRSLGSLIASLNQSDPLPPWCESMQSLQPRPSVKDNLTIKKIQVFSPITSKHYIKQSHQRLRTTLRPSRTPLYISSLPRTRIPRPHSIKHPRTTTTNKARPPSRRLGGTRSRSRDRTSTRLPRHREPKPGNPGRTETAIRGRARGVMGVGTYRSKRGGETEELGRKLYAWGAGDGYTECCYGVEEAIGRWW